MLESERDKISNMSFSMERTRFAMESLKDTAEHVAVMKSATSTFREHQKAIKIDDLEDMQDDLADMMVDAEEINEVLSRSYGMPNDVSEADLDAELAGLMDEPDYEGLSAELGGLDDVSLDAPAASYATPSYAARDEYSSFPAIPTAATASAVPMSSAPALATSSRAALK